MNRTSLLLPILVVSLVCTACSPKHEANVRERTQKLITLLLAENYDACAELADPMFVRQNGLNGAKIRFGIVGFFAKAGKVTKDKVRIDEITVGSEAKTAKVRLSIQIGDEWKSIDPWRWVRDDGQWYFSF